MNLWKRFCGDCEGMAHDVGDDDHAYEFVEEFLQLKKNARQGCGSWSSV